MKSNLTSQVKHHVDRAKSVLIVTHERPTADSIGSSLALYLALSAMGKHVAVACPDPITVDLSSFVGANKVQTEVSQKNFIISLDYVEGSIEKVSYNIEGDKFNLVIEPREGFEPFSQDKVSYSYAGANADLIFAVDTIHLGGLKTLFESDKNLFASKPIVNVDYHPNNANYGAINLVDPKASSTAELIAEVLREIGATLTADIATNLLNALYGATENFTTKTVSPTAFEVAATCLKAGGRRFAAEERQKSTTPVQQEDSQADMNSQQPIHEEKKSEEAVKEVQPQESADKKQEDTQVSQQNQKETPADWLRPKIFKSSNS